MKRLVLPMLTVALLSAAPAHGSPVIDACLGISPVGDALQVSLLNSGTGFCAPEGVTETFTVTPPVGFNFVGITTGTQTLGLLDPVTNALSDILSVTIAPSSPGFFGLTVTLTSDAEQPLVGTTEITITETGSPQDVTSMFTLLSQINSTFGTGSVDVLVQSDVEAATPVPEPASLVLLGTGLVATVSRFRRRRSTPHTATRR